MNHLEKEQVVLYDIDKILQCVRMGTFRSAWRYCWHLAAFVYYCAKDEELNEPYPMIPYDPQPK